MNLFKRTATRRIVFFVLADVCLIALAVWLSFLIRFDGQIPSQYTNLILRMIILAVLFTIPVFYFQKLYFFSWSYVSASEAITLFKATTISFILLAIFTYTLHALRYLLSFTDFPRSTFFISYLLVFIFCIGIRFSKRIYLDIVGLNRISDKEKTLIVGAGDAGEQILRNMLSSQGSSYFPVGFVDDNPIKQGVKIHGLKVLGTVLDIPVIVKTHEVKQLIVAMPSADNALIKKAVQLGRQAGLYKIKIAPPIAEFMRGEISLKNLKDVDVEDLLGRNPVDLDRKKIEQFINGKTALITGAAGSIGSELSRQVAKFKPSLLVILDQDETGIFTISNELKKRFSALPVKSIVADITDQEKIRHIFESTKPQIVFHAAAYKHVPLMEDQPDVAVKNNIFGTHILAQTSVAFGVEKFIFISTDKAVNPTSVMGATKRVCEMICQAHNQWHQTKFISVRFGNVLNSRGSVIPIFKEQIRKGGPVEVTDPKMQRYFMLTSEACLLVMQAGAIGNGGEVFVLDMGKPIKIVDLAREMIKLSGFIPDKDIAIVFIGLRPGEKLFEEILTAEEGTAATQHQKIFAAKMAQIDPVTMEKNVDTLKNIIYKGGRNEIIDTLKSITPYYK